MYGQLVTRINQVRPSQTYTLQVLRRDINKAFDAKQINGQQFLSLLGLLAIQV